MKFFKNRKFIVALVLLTVLSIELVQVFKIRNVNTVRAFAHLTVDLGVPSGEPIFTVNNMLPGDCEDREVGVRNDGDEEDSISVRSDNETDLDFLSRALNMEIYDGVTLLYSDTLEQFFMDSETLDGVPLSPLSPGEEKVFTFEVCFQETAGNEYQNTEVIFDLIFGQVISPIQLPEECRHLTGIITFVVEGTEEDDDIRASIESELILGYGGDDELDGSRGDDCIVGADGVDEIDGGEGNDVILGSEQDDEIDGGQGDDIIYGYEGDDEIDAGSGKDLVYGGIGNDDIDGRSDDDEIYGGPGNDIIDGGSGEDMLFGEEGDDEIDGSTQNDYLDGGPDEDELDGGTGTDECVNGETLDSCEA